MGARRGKKEKTQKKEREMGKKDNKRRTNGLKDNGATDGLSESRTKRCTE